MRMPTELRERAESLSKREHKARGLAKARKLSRILEDAIARGLALMERELDEEPTAANGRAA